MTQNRKATLLSTAGVILATGLFALAVSGGATAAAGEVDSSPSPSASTSTSSSPSPSPSVTSPSPSPSETPPGGEGCTPGYWKNHPSAWPTGVSPSATVGSVFTGAGSYSGTTLLAALSLQGGTGVTGATETLLRAAVAAYLNSLTVDYAYSTAEVVSMVNAALASGDRATMLAVAAALDSANNAGCPL